MKQPMMLGLAALGGIATGTGLWYMFVYRPKKMAALATAAAQKKLPAQKPASVSTTKPAATPAPTPKQPEGPIERTPSSAMNASQGSILKSGGFTDQNGYGWNYQVVSNGLSVSWTVRYSGTQNSVYGMPAPMSGTAQDVESAVSKAKDVVEGWVSRRESMAANEKLSTVFG